MAVTELTPLENEAISTIKEAIDSAYKSICDVSALIDKFLHVPEYEEAIVLRFDDKHLVLDCPYCGKRHQHPYNDKWRIGAAVIYTAQCSPPLDKENPEEKRYRAIFPEAVHPSTKDLRCIKNSTGTHWITFGKHATSGKEYSYEEMDKYVYSETEMAGSEKTEFEDLIENLGGLQLRGGNEEGEIVTKFQAMITAGKGFVDSSYEALRGFPTPSPKAQGITLEDRVPARYNDGHPVYRIYSCTKRAEPGQSGEEIFNIHTWPHRHSKTGERTVGYLDRGPGFDLIPFCSGAIGLRNGLPVDDTMLSRWVREFVTENRWSDVHLHDGQDTHLEVKAIMYYVVIHGFWNPRRSEYRGYRTFPSPPSVLISYASRTLITPVLYINNIMCPNCTRFLQLAIENLKIKMRVLNIESGVDLYEPNKCVQGSYREVPVSRHIGFAADECPE
ncbi:hypothetical protein ABW19_dt0202921 [Dactylella cylindrospora]|nr:hypothetical protein ABW19_dt0202921 [Dactylella cylindrospora]